MNKKLVYGIGAVVALIIAYSILKSCSHTEAPTKVHEQPANLNKPKSKDQDTTSVPSKEQQLIDGYTASLNAGKNENGNVYFQRGLIFLQLNQNRKAIADFTAALGIVPDSPYLLYNRALAYQQNLQLDLAIVDLNAAIKAKPDFADAYNTRGLIFVDQQDFDSALLDYNEAIKLNPKFTQAYFNLGTMYARQKKFEDAKKSFTQAIALYAPPADATQEQLALANKETLQAYLNRANVELESGDTDAALADATYVVTNAPHNLEALRLRAEIYNRMGNSAAAAEDSATADSLSLQNMLNEK